MPITKVLYHDHDKLLRRLRQVTLQGTGEKIYADCSAQVRPLPLWNIRPAQNYVLRQDLERVRDLRRAVFDFCSADILHLAGFLEVHFAEYLEPVDILPPVVEVHTESDGTRVNLVVDGMHRLYLAWLEWVRPTVVLIQHVPHLYYAYPLRGDDPWSRVELREDLPENYIKRWHRVTPPKHKDLFRQFDAPGPFNTRHVSR